MTIHEFGEASSPILLLLHPSLVRWDYFELVIPLLEKEYHVIVPALPGYDPDREGDFTGVEQIAEELGGRLNARGVDRIFAAYGCSMGGSIALRLSVDGKIAVDHTILDGGITPYQLPWILTRFIALRDFLLMAIGKKGGLKLLEKVFATDDYSAEDLRYVADVMDRASYKTLWRTFDSCNNYAMPSPLPPRTGAIHYWYAENEMKERSWDIKYMKKFFPATRFREFPALGHAGLVLKQPETFANLIRALDTPGGEGST